MLHYFVVSNSHFYQQIVPLKSLMFETRRIQGSAIPRNKVVVFFIFYPDLTVKEGKIGTGSEVCESFLTQFCNSY